MASASLRSPSRRSGCAAAPSAPASSSSAFILASVERRRCSAAASSGLGDELVADSTNGLDPARLLQGAADLMNRLLNAVLEPAVGRSPNSLEQLRATHHLTRPAGKQLQHQKGPAFELQGAFAKPCLATRKIDPQAPADNDSSLSGPLPERSSDACQQHLPVGALDDVVGRAALDADDLVRGRVARAGEDDDGK